MRRSKKDEGILCYCMAIESKPRLRRLTGLRKSELYQVFYQFRYTGFLFYSQNVTFLELSFIGDHFQRLHSRFRLFFR